MDGFADRLKYGFGDLTAVGRPSTSPSLVTNEQLYYLNPERFNFYIQLTTALMLGDPSIVYKALGIENATRFQRKKVKDLLDNIGKELGQLSASEEEGKLEQQGGDYWRNLKNKLNDANYHEKIDVAKGNENHYIYGPSTMEVSTTDRVVFIAMTFALRSFSLTFLEWAMTNRMVNSTETAIVFYVGIYVLIFALWAIVVNVGKRDLFFKVAFFFINTQGPRGLINIILHIFLQILLLPIPFILQSINARNSRQSNYMSFEERRKTLRMVGNLSFLMWLVSSLVALRA